MRNQLYDQLIAEIEAWHGQQQDQQDGYEYETSFVELWHKLGQQVLQESMGALPESRHKKKIKTSFGWLTCAKTHPVVQAAPPFQMSPYLQERLCFVGQKEIYQEASTTLDELVGELVGVAVSAKQIERVSHHFGALVEEAEPAEPTGPPAEATGAPEPLVYAMVDGSMVPARQTGWREINPTSYQESIATCSYSCSRPTPGTSFALIKPTWCVWLS